MYVFALAGSEIGVLALILTLYLVAVGTDVQVTVSWSARGWKDDIGWGIKGWWEGRVLDYIRN